MNAEQLKVVLAEHADWLAGRGGKRADLFVADLRGRDLCGACLRDATLRGSCSQGSDLRGADLRGADIRDANLRGACLRDADLSGSCLRDACLQGADLRGACLRDADLSGSCLRDACIQGADLQGANLRKADLSGADLRWARLPFALEIPDIDAAILQAVRRDGCSLSMGRWHTCATAHCRGGWAIVLAGEAGQVAEQLLGVEAAAALIYANSRNKPVPDFYASDEDAMADLIACAEGGVS